MLKLEKPQDHNQPISPSTILSVLEGESREKQLQVQKTKESLYTLIIDAPRLKELGWEKLGFSVMNYCACINAGYPPPISDRNDLMKNISRNAKTEFADQMAGFLTAVTHDSRAKIAGTFSELVNLGVFIDQGGKFLTEDADNDLPQVAFSDLLTALNHAEFQGEFSADVMYGQMLMFEHFPSSIRNNFGLLPLSLDIDLAASEKDVLDLAYRSMYNPKHILRWAAARVCYPAMYTSYTPSSQVWEYMSKCLEKETRMFMYAQALHCLDIILAESIDTTDGLKINRAQTFLEKSFGIGVSKLPETRDF